MKLDKSCVFRHIYFQNSMFSICWSHNHTKTAPARLSWLITVLESVDNALKVVVLEQSHREDYTHHSIRCGTCVSRRGRKEKAHYSLQVVGSNLFVS